MRLETISIKTLTIGVLLTLGLLFTTLSFVAGSYFKQVALDSQAKSLSRIIEVAGEHTFSGLGRKTTAFATGFQNQEALRRELAHAGTGSTTQLATLLDEPFRKGFADTASIDLAKLRVFDLDLKLVAESHEGVTGLAPQLPPFLQQQAAGRKGVERLKALAGIWISPSGPLYSVLVPIGGLHVAGYLEVCVDPAFNFASVAAITKMPLKVYGMDGKLIYQSPLMALHNGHRYLTVEYLFPSASGEPAFRMIGEEDVESFRRDMRQAQVMTTIAFLALTGTVLLLALWVFNRFLFRPIGQMMENIRMYSEEGRLVVSAVKGCCAREFYALSVAFADMMARIRDSIQELEHLSSIDGLTGVPNRRSLDAAMEQEWQRARRERTTLSLLLIDLDFFKNYNDNYGHQAGDDCLKLVAATIAQVAKRPGDLVARYGGEEFAVLLPATPAEGAILLANQLRDAVARLQIAHQASAVSKVVTLSIGISTLLPGEDAPNPYYLVGYADEALYRAKEKGRDRVEIANSIE